MSDSDTSDSLDEHTVKDRKQLISTEGNTSCKIQEMHNLSLPSFVSCSVLQQHYTNTRAVLPYPLIAAHIGSRFVLEPSYCDMTTFTG